MLANEEAKARQVTATAMEDARYPTEAERIGLGRAREYFDWEKAPGRDVRTLSGIESYLNIGDLAKRKAAQDRFGTGAFQLAGGANEQYATQLRALKSQEMAQEVGAGLEQAVAARRAEAVGSLLPYSQLGLQRQLGRLGAATQREGAYLTAPRETPFWQQLTLAAVAGGSQVASAAFKNGSDIRWKTEITEIPYGLSEVIRLRSVKYTMNDTYEEIGFIAQEVEELMPEFVFHDENGYLYLDYAHMTAVLAKAIQELKEELDILKKG